MKTKPDYIQAMERWLTRKPGRLHKNLADLAGLKSPNIIGMYLRQGRVPSDETALALAKAIGADPVRFILSVHASNNDNPEIQAIFTPETISQLGQEMNISLVDGMKIDNNQLILPANFPEQCIKQPASMFQLLQLESGNYLIIPVPVNLAGLTRLDKVVIHLRKTETRHLLDGKYYLLVDPKDKSGIVVRMKKWQPEDGVWIVETEFNLNDYTVVSMNIDYLSFLEIYPIVGALQSL